MQSNFDKQADRQGFFSIPGRDDLSIEQRIADIELRLDQMDRVIVTKQIYVWQVTNVAKDTLEHVRDQVEKGEMQ